MKQLSQDELRTLVEETANEVLENNSKTIRQRLAQITQEENTQDARVTMTALILTQAQVNCADTIIQVLGKLLY